VIRFRYYSEFNACQKKYDAFKGSMVPEAVNDLAFLKNDYTSTNFLLTCNSTIVKLWSIRE
jgi:hypothetical protein